MMRAAGLVIVLSVVAGIASGASEGRRSTQSNGEARAPATAKNYVTTSTARSAVATYWRDSGRGWFWYEDPLLEPPEEPVDAHPPKAAEEVRAPELIEMERLQKQVDSLRKIAIIRPTETNVRRYLELEAQVFAMSAKFSEMTQRVAWTTPSLDPSWQNRPANKAALDVYDAQTRDGRLARIRELSETHVLFFFFRSDCPYCHAYAPILAQFEKTLGLRVVPVSLDGGGLPEFPNPRTDNGIATRLGVATVPATFLAAPFDGTISAVGAGVLNESQLLERITVVASPEMRSEVPGATKQLTLD